MSAFHNIITESSSLSILATGSICWHFWEPEPGPAWLHNLVNDNALTFFSYNNQLFITNVPHNVDTCCSVGKRGFWPSTLGLKNIASLHSPVTAHCETNNLWLLGQYVTNPKVLI